MAKLTLHEALQQIKSGKVASSYFLVGKEKLFHDSFINTTIDSIFVEKSSKDLNLTILYGTENTLSEVLSASLSFPMLANHKLVLVRDFDQMKISNSETLKKYLENPQKSTCLILSASEKGRAKIYDDIARLSETIDCSPIPEYKVGDWITQQCNQRGHKIDPQAVQLLISLSGASLLGLEQELSKIIDYKSDSSVITVDDLEKTTGISKEANIFALQRALSRRRLEQSLKIAGRLLDTGSDIPSITAVLFAFFRKMLRVASLVSKRTERKKIAEQMKLRDFQMKEIYEGLSHFNTIQLEGVIEFLLMTDLNSKTSTTSKKAAIQTLCYNICKV